MALEAVEPGRGNSEVRRSSSNDDEPEWGAAEIAAESRKTAAGATGGAGCFPVWVEVLGIGDALSHHSS
jgi:hypothetical protein